MELLEKILLSLTIIVPLFFIIIGIVKYKRVKKSKKFRNTLIKLILLSLIINGLLFGIVKNYNDKNLQPDNEHSDKNNQNSSHNNPEEGSVDVNKPTTPEENKTSKGYKIETIDGVTYVDGYLVVNKTYPLPQDYVPTGTHKTVNAEICQECIIEEAYQAYSKMRTDAVNQGLKIWIASGYRSYSYQNSLYNGYVKRSGQEAADTFSARAGHSEHQSGYAFDLNSVTDAFATTKEGIWVADNCQKYGFIIRYPKGKEDETGYKYESWHLRYVGVDLANKLYNNGDWITMEDYFGLTSEYQN